MYDPNKPRSRLEERLRASLSFGIGEVSNPSTEVSTNATNTPISTKAPTPLPSAEAEPLSPTQKPLPDSPIGSPTAETRTVNLPSPLSLGDPLGASSVVSPTSSLSRRLASLVAKSESHLEPSAASIDVVNGDVPLSEPVPSHHESKALEESLAEKLERVIQLEEDDKDFHGRRYAEAQMPLPPTPPSESSELSSVDPPTPDVENPPAVVDNADVPATVSAESLQRDVETDADRTRAAVSFNNNADGDTAGTDVEALRQQLKRFKERFTGSKMMDFG